MKRLKLLIIIHSLDVGGAESQVYELARSLDKTRFEPVVCALTGAGPYVGKLKAAGIRVVVIAERLRHMPWRIFELVRLIRHERFDIVQNFMFTAALFGTIVARVCGVPIVINCIRSLGFLHYTYRKPIKRILYRLSDCVIANSKQIEAALIDQRIVSSEKIHVIYNGIDVEKYCPREPEKVKGIKDALGLSAYSPVVGMIANLTAVKNHRCFLNAIPRINKEFPNAAFLLIGDGTLKETLQQSAESLGIGARVFFWV